MSVVVGVMPSHLVVAIRRYIYQQTGKETTITNLDYSLFNDRIHFIVEEYGNYRINLVKGTISRPSRSGYGRVSRVNSIESGSAQLAVITSILLKG